MATIERKSSIDCEPPTLKFDQIQYAREAALYVLNTKGFEEALRTFTEGLELEVERVWNGKVIEAESDEECNPSTSMENSMLPTFIFTVVKDVASAPF